MPEDTTDDPTSDRELIRAAADQHGVDLDHAIVSFDEDPDSDRVFIIEDTHDGGYRLMAFGKDSAGTFTDECSQIHIPDTAVGGIQGLLHAAGMHVVEKMEHGVARGEDGRQMPIRDLAEMMELTQPMEPREGEPRAVWAEDESEGDADPEEGDQ